MFTLSKLLTPLLLPPGLFLLLALAALFYFHRRRMRAGVSLLTLLVGLVYLLSIRPVADSLILPLEDAYPGPAGARPACGVIAVFGGGAVPSGPSPDDSAQPGASSALRAHSAFAIWRKAPAQIILSGGGARGEHWNSARAMGAFLKNLGVPGDFLTLEQESRNTFENAKFTASLLKKHNYSNPCLITSAYHMPRAVRSLALFDVSVIPFPSDFKAYRDDYGWRHALPTMQSLSISVLALHEYLGLLFYMLVYGI